MLGSLIGYVVLKQRQTEPPAPSAAVHTPAPATAEGTNRSPSRRLKKQDTSPAPREVSMWETNVAAPARSSARPINPVPSPTPPPEQRSGSPTVADRLMNQLSQID